MLTYLIFIISILLDGILTNYLPFLVNDLSYLTPLLTVVSIFIIYPLNRKKELKFFILIALVSKLIYKNFEISYIKLILYIIIIIILYESVYAGILFIYQVVPITFYKLVYKITHTLLLNIVYVEILYFIIKHIPNKYKKISIN